MKHKCEGCDCELEMAIEYQDDYGLHQATSTEREYEDMEHFAVWMVDDEGELQVE